MSSFLMRHICCNVNMKCASRTLNMRFLSAAFLTPQHHVFVGNLPLEYSLDTVNDFLKSNKVIGFSEPRLAVSPKGKFRGFVFLDFDSLDLAQNAMVLLKDTVADGRPVKVDLTDSKDGVKKGRRSGRLNENLQLFIGNIPFKITNDVLTDIIQDQIGKENHFLVKLHNDGVQSLGYCHVTFSHEEDLNVVIKNMHLSELSGRVINVERAVPKIKEDDAPKQNTDRVLSAEEEEEEKLAEIVRQQNAKYEIKPTEEVRYRPSMERRLARKAQQALLANQRSSLGSGRDAPSRFLLGSSSLLSGRGENTAAGRGQLALVGRDRDLGGVRDWRAGAHGDSNRKREASVSSRSGVRVNFASRGGESRFSAAKNGDRNDRRGGGDKKVTRFGGGKRKGVQTSGGKGGGRRYMSTSVKSCELV